MIETLTALAILQAVTAQTAAPPAPPPSACASEEYAAFDFWLGQWEVAPNGVEPNGTSSTIERVSSGCVIREHWKPISGRDGTSISFFNSETGRWEQVWVGSDGQRVDFAGGIVDGKMVLTGYWRGAGQNGSDVLVRMTYTKREDGSVQQFGEASTDHGLSWQTSFDLIYTPKDSE